MKRIKNAMQLQLGNRLLAARDHSGKTHRKS